MIEIYKGVYCAWWFFAWVFPTWW